MHFWPCRRSLVASAPPLTDRSALLVLKLSRLSTALSSCSQRRSQLQTLQLLSSVLRSPSRDFGLVDLQTCLLACLTEAMCGTSGSPDCSLNASSCTSSNDRVRCNCCSSSFRLTSCAGLALDVFVAVSTRNGHSCDTCLLPHRHVHVPSRSSDSFQTVGTCVWHTTGPSTTLSMNWICGTSNVISIMNTCHCSCP